MGKVIVTNWVTLDAVMQAPGKPEADVRAGCPTVVAFARSEEKPSLAKENGARHGVNTRDKSAEHVQDQLEQLTGRRDVVGRPEW